MSLSRIVAVEPNVNMQEELKAEALRQFQSEDKVEVYQGTLEKYVATRPHEAGTFDFVISTLTLCSVDNVHDNVHYINHLLKQGGKLIVLEHVAARPGTVYAVIQRLFTPLWKLYTGSCELDHDTDREIRHCKSFETHVPDAPISLFPFVSGYAVKNASH